MDFNQLFTRANHSRAGEKKLVKVDSQHRITSVFLPPPTQCISHRLDTNHYFSLRKGGSFTLAFDPISRNHIKNMFFLLQTGYKQWRNKRGCDFFIFLLFCRQDISIAVFDLGSFFSSGCFSCL